MINRSLFLLLCFVLGLQGCQSTTQPKRFGKNLTAITKPGSDYNPIGLSANRHVNLLGAGLSYPPADWYQQFSMRNMHGQSEHFQKNDGHRVTFAEVPAGETFDNPSQLYAFDARLLDFEVEGEKEIGYLWRDIYKECHQDLIINRVQKYGADTAFFCERIQMSAADKARGFITITRLIKSDLVEVEVSHTWSGKPFSYTREESWPISKNKIDQVAINLGFVQLRNFKTEGPD